MSTDLVWEFLCGQHHDSSFLCGNLRERWSMRSSVSWVCWGQTSFLCTLPSEKKQNVLCSRKELTKIKKITAKIKGKDVNRFKFHDKTMFSITYSINQILNYSAKIVFMHLTTTKKDCRSGKQIWGWGSKQLYSCTHLLVISLFVFGCTVLKLLFLGSRHLPPLGRALLCELCNLREREKKTTKLNNLKNPTKEFIVTMQNCRKNTLTKGENYLGDRAPGLTGLLSAVSQVEEISRGWSLWLVGILGLLAWRTSGTLRTTCQEYFKCNIYPYFRSDPINWNRYHRTIFQLTAEFYLTMGNSYIENTIPYFWQAPKAMFCVPKYNNICN